MVLSMLPMQVFGNPRPFEQVLLTERLDDGRNVPAHLAVNVNLTHLAGAFAPAGSELFIEILLTGGSQEWNAYNEVSFRNWFSGPHFGLNVVGDRRVPFLLGPRGVVNFGHTGRPLDEEDGDWEPPIVLGGGVGSTAQAFSSNLDVQPQRLVRPAAFRYLPDIPPMTTAFFGRIPATHAIHANNITTRVAVTPAALAPFGIAPFAEEEEETEMVEATVADRVRNRINFPIVDPASSAQRLLIPFDILNPPQVHEDGEPQFDGAGDPIFAWDAGNLRGGDDSDWQWSGLLQLNLWAVMRDRDAQISVRIVRRAEGGQWFNVGDPMLGAQHVFAGAEAGAVGGIITPGQMAVVATHGLLHPITLTERHPGQFVPNDVVGGDFAGQFGVRLVAPHGYRWDISGLGAVDQLAVGVPVGAGQLLNEMYPEEAGFPAVGGGGLGPYRAANPAGAMLSLPDSYLRINSVTQRHELNLAIAVAGRSSQAAAAMPLAVEIRNLVLVAMPNAPEEGYIYVEVYVIPDSRLPGMTDRPNQAQVDQWRTWHDGGRATPPPGFFTDWVAWHSAGRPEGEPPVPQVGVRGSFSANWLGAVDGQSRDLERHIHPVPEAWNHVADHPHWHNMEVLVARRGVGLVEVTVPEDVFVGTTGTRSAEWNYRSGVAHQWFTRNHYTVRLMENVPGALRAGIGQYEFRFVDPGVRFESVELRVNHNALGVIEAPLLPNVDRWHPLLGQPRLNAAGQPLAENDSVIIPALSSLDPYLMRIGFRPLTTSIHPSHVDFRFQIITEAGFENRTGDGYVRLHITGPGVDEIVVIAQALDSIHMLPHTPVTLHRDGFGVTGVTPINPVSFREAAPGTFRVGDVIFPNVVTVQNEQIVFLSGINEVAINNLAAPIVDTASGLELRAIPGTHLLAWEVVAPSIATPAEVTFDSLALQGALIPDIEYHIEIGGPRITRTTTRWSLPGFVPPDAVFVDGVNVTVRNNDRIPDTGPIWVDERTGTTEMPPRQDARFEEITHSVIVINVEGDDDFGGNIAPPIGEVPGDVVVTPPAVGRPPIPMMTLAWGQASFTTPTITVQSPVRTHRFPGDTPGTDRTLVAVRVLESVLNIPHGNLHWDGDTQTATVTAPNAAGQPVELRMTVGQPTAFINGEPVNLQVAGGFPEGAVITPQHIGGSVFLPLRVVFDVFEVPFTWNDATRTITIGG